MSKTDNYIIEHHNKELELFDKTLHDVMWYDSILDFLECIDQDWVWKWDLETMKLMLRPLYKHLILWE